MTQRFCQTTQSICGPGLEQIKLSKVSVFIVGVGSAGGSPENVKCGLISIIRLS